MSIDVTLPEPAEPVAHFPLFLNLSGRLCTIVGGSKEVARKAALLVRMGARLRVVAPALAPAFRPWLSAGRCEHLAVEFSPAHLASSALVVVDADDAENRAVADAARLLSVPVNVVDKPELCSFFWPAIIDRAPVIVAISTGGTAPALARKLRLELDALLPDRLGRLAALAGRFRAEIRRRLHDGETRRGFWQRAFAGRFAKLAAAGCEEEAIDALQSQLDPVSEEPAAAAPARSKPFRQTASR